MATTLRIAWLLVRLPFIAFAVALEVAPISMALIAIIVLAMLQGSQP